MDEPQVSLIFPDSEDGSGSLKGSKVISGSCQETKSYQSGTEPGIYSLQLAVERLKEPALKIPLHHPSGVHP